ncbi:1782_t:CDS:1 [Paraglomus brasilianum]|uniref:1782_t:CDS:1 n=1 Tax=Paraglomus brasilianum TaxID=144538 RepID=A0A9N9FHA1_9GLOM|nr:1782_t:CDS:1 [Paraglomus brasilianum]
MAASLPCELLVMILHMNGDDCSILRSHMLVNKAWHNVAIQYLWAKPFTLLYEKYIASGRRRTFKQRAENLLTTFIRSFTDAQLVNERVDSLVKMCSKSSQSTNYNLHLKEIYLKEIQELVALWIDLSLEYHKYSHVTGDRTNKLAHIIVGLVIQHCQQLRKLSLIPLNAPSYHLLGQLFDSAKDLSQLRVFSWKGTSYMKIFSILSELACNLEEVSFNFYNMKLYYYKETDNFQKFVQSQRRLKSITIERLLTNMSSMLKLLNVHSESLESIQWVYVCFDTDDLSAEQIELCQLKSISMRCCDVTEGGLNSLSVANIPRLQQLVIGNCNIPDVDWEQFFHKHGKALIDIDISSQRLLADESFMVISRLCVNLRHLCVSVPSNRALRNVADLVANQPNLHSLTLRYQTGSGREDNYTTLFNTLSEYRFSNLDYLELYSTREFDVDSLDNFLSKSKPPLTSLIICDTYITEKHFNVILDHLSGTLKVLRAEYDISLDDEKRVKSVVGNFSQYSIRNTRHLRCNAEICTRRHKI